MGATQLSIRFCPGVNIFISSHLKLCYFEWSDINLKVWTRRGICEKVDSGQM